MLYGPNTNQGGNSIIIILEGQAQFVAATLESMRALGASSVDVRPEAMQRYMDELESALGDTVWSSGCASYFRAAGGEIVTQLPHTSRWYCERTMHFCAGDFVITRRIAEVLPEEDRVLSAGPDLNR